VTRALRIVEQLLDEAILAPFIQWDLEHIMKQYKKRIRMIPENIRLDHMRDIEANFRAFNANTQPIVVGDRMWWMPFPFGWRLCGDNSIAKTMLAPSQTIVAERVENPFLPPAHESWWRGKE
jgi:hypothetical protein